MCVSVSAAKIDSRPKYMRNCLADTIFDTKKKLLGCVLIENHFSELTSCCAGHDDREGRNQT